MIDYFHAYHSALPSTMHCVICVDDVTVDIYNGVCYEEVKNHKVATTQQSNNDNSVCFIKMI